MGDRVRSVRGLSQRPPWSAPSLQALRARYQRGASTWQRASPRPTPAGRQGCRQQRPFSSFSTCFILFSPHVAACSPGQVHRHRNGQRCTRCESLPDQCGLHRGIQPRSSARPHRRCRFAGPHRGLRCSSGVGARPSSARRLTGGPQLAPITDELTSALAFGQHAFALDTVIALVERSRSNQRSRAARPDRRVRWPSRLVATASEDRLNISPWPCEIYGCLEFGSSC